MKHPGCRLVSRSHSNVLQYSLLKYLKTHSTKSVLLYKSTVCRNIKSYLSREQQHGDVMTAVGTEWDQDKSHRQGTERFKKKKKKSFQCSAFWSLALGDRKSSGFWCVLNIVFLFMYSSLKALLFNTFCIVILSTCICVHVGSLVTGR